MTTEEKSREVYPLVHCDDWDKEQKLVAQHLDRRVAFICGYELAKQDLGWHSVDESLPEIGEEVIVLIPYCRAVAAETQYQIISAQLIQPAQYMNTDEKIWNVPGVKFWMPMPKIPEE